MSDASPVSTQRPKRSLFLRILFGFLWFVAFYFLSNIFVGAVVGGIAGASTTTFEAGAMAGQQASIKFFEKYGVIVFLLQVVTFAILCFFRLLPGVGKYRGAR